MIARVAVVGAALALGAPPALAQDGERSLPTLESLGIGPWSSDDGTVQFGLSGRADVDVYMPSDDPTYLISATEPFVAPRVRLFGDLFLGDRLYATAELHFDRSPSEAWSNGFDFRLEQAFMRYTPLDAIALQAGRFASPFAGYASRHHTAADWFIRPPLLYEYRTTALAAEIPEDAEDWLAWKDSAGEYRDRGAPPVWGAPYQWGGMAFGTLRDLAWRVAYMNSAPASGPNEWDALDFERGNLVAGLGYRFAPWVRVDVSYSTGPFMTHELADWSASVPDGHELSDYTQNIFAGELLFELYHTQVRAEAFHDTWRIARVYDDAIDISWSLEARQELFQDAFIAGRVGQIRFSDITYDPPATPIGDSEDEPWDYNVRRIQVAAGYKLARNAEIRAEYLTNATDGPVDPDDDLMSVQLWWAF